MMSSLPFSTRNYFSQKLWSGEDFSHFFRLCCLVVFKATQSLLLSCGWYFILFFRIGKHLGEFESLFLADLDNGEMANKSSYSGLEGVIHILTMVLLKINWISSKHCMDWGSFFFNYRIGDLWMNLDGSISPICLNILALASSSSELVLWDFLCSWLI